MFVTFIFVTFMKIIIAMLARNIQSSWNLLFLTYIRNKQRIYVTCRLSGYNSKNSNLDKPSEIALVQTSTCAKAITTTFDKHFEQKDTCNLTYYFLHYMLYIHYYIYLKNHRFWTFKLYS